MIKQIPSHKPPPLKQRELASLSQDYRFSIAGNYHTECSSMIKSALIRRLLEVKKRVIGVRAKKMTLVVIGKDGLSGLALRVCRQLGLETSVEPELSEEQRQVIELVLTVKLVPGPRVAETTAEQLEEQYDKQVDPWTDNDSQLAIEIPVVTDLQAKPPVDLTKLDNPTPTNDKRNDYSGFNHIDQWKDQNIREVEPSMDRNEIPEHGPGVTPDTDKAGGLQES